MMEYKALYTVMAVVTVVAVIKGLGLWRTYKNEHWSNIGATCFVVLFLNAVVYGIGRLFIFIWS